MDNYLHEKSEIFVVKKDLNKNFFLVITKNLNWEILRILLLLKNGMGLRIKNFNIMGFTGKFDF